MTTTLVDGLREAEGINDPDDFIRRVKGLVITELSNVDPTASIEDTHYFNHSAIPDLVVSWGDKGQRYIYLRDSYQAVVANQDADQLSSVEPVILAYSHESEVVELESAAADLVSQSLATTTRTLVTEPAVLDRLSQDNDSIDPSPLLSLVRGNFISGGRGLVDATTSDAVLHAESTSVDVGLLFRPEVAGQISSARAMMAAALNPDAPIDTSLPRDQLIQVLPWLLSTDGVRQDTAYWRAVGEHASLDFLLKELRQKLTGLELLPLVRANIDRLVARRGYLGVSAVDPDREPGPLWAIRGGRLERKAGEQAMVFSANRHLEGAPGTSSATWEQLRTSLAEFGLRSVSLRGLQRDVQLDTERRDDLREDVDRVVASLEDNYFVDKVVVGFPREGSEVHVSIDLDRRLVSAEDGATLTELVRTLGSLVSYRSPITVTEVGH